MSKCELKGSCKIGKKRLMFKTVTVTVGYNRNIMKGNWCPNLCLAKNNNQSEKGGVTYGLSMASRALSWYVSVASR